MGGEVRSAISCQRRLELVQCCKNLESSVRKNVKHLPLEQQQFIFIFMEQQQKINMKNHEAGSHWHH